MKKRINPNEDITCFQITSLVTIYAIIALAFVCFGPAWTLGSIFVLGVIEDIRAHMRNEVCSCGGGPGRAEWHMVFCEKYCECVYCQTDRASNGEEVNE